MPGVKYIGPVLDGSGYAEAARNYALSIHRKGYPITIAPISFERTRPDLGEDGRVLASLIKKPIDYDKIIVHSTPDLWANYTHFESNKYIIGYTVWETSKLHPLWVGACNRANEIWLPCDWNMDVFKNSGVRTPLLKIPHAIDLPNLEVIPGFNLGDVVQNDFVFYSIFQWQERKNPYGLLGAYSVAFSGIHDVVLVLKTYKFDHSGDKDTIRQSIVEYRNQLTLEHLPKIFLVVENMSKESMMALHKRCDAFVLLQRSEGWGLPHFEAAACGKPVITPGYGGQTEFLNKDNSYLVDYSLTPVIGMKNFSGYYQSSQYWCEPDMAHAISSMQDVYANREQAKVKGLEARKNIEQNFTWDKIGDMIVKRLTDIDRGLIRNG